MTKDITFHKAAQAYLGFLQELGKHPRTLYTYGKDLEQIEAFFGKERKLSSILKPHVGKFLKSETLLNLPEGRMRSPKTVYKTIRVMRFFFVWALETGLIDSLPLPKEVPMGNSLKKQPDKD